MQKVSVRELRNQGGDVLARVEHGESLVVTRDGLPVAELRPLPRRNVSSADLIARRANLPDVDVIAFEADIDAVIDPTL